MSHALRSALALSCITLVYLCMATPEVTPGPPKGETVIEVVEPEPDPLADLVGGEIAEAIRTEAERSKLDPKLILGIILTENPWLKPDTINSYGAVGLMQVVEWLHGGEYPECGEDLTDVATNLCYGVRIFERKLEVAQGDTTRALLFFNGCWGETYTAGCEDYPNKVKTRGAF